MFWRTYIISLAKGACGPRTLAVAISLAVIAALPFFLARPYWQPGQYSLHIQLATDTRSVAQVYFDLGKGYSDANSSRRPLEPKSLQAIEIVSLSIPTGRLQRVRIDPIDRAGKFVLGSAK